MAVIESINHHRLFHDPAAFMRGVHGLLKAGGVRLLEGGKEVPDWRLRELLDRTKVIDNLDSYRISTTPQGVKKIAEGDVITSIYK